MRDRFARVVWMQMTPPHPCAHHEGGGGGTYGDHCALFLHTNAFSPPIERSQNGKTIVRSRRLHLQMDLHLFHTVSASDFENVSARQILAQPKNV